MMSDAANQFAAYENDATVVSINDLTIENGTESISLHGSLDIDCSKKGLDTIRALATITNNILQKLEQLNSSSAGLPDKIEGPKTYAGKDPFGRN